MSNHDLSVEVTSLPSQREHHLDAVRGLLMLLGIPFHAAHPFRADGEKWLVSSSYHSEVLTSVIDFLHLFRMQGFFVVAGYFSAMLIMKRDRNVFLMSRMGRLLPPLLVALILIVPIMNLAAAVQIYGQDNGVKGWIDQIRHPGRSIVGHLWFVIVLIYYTISLWILSTLFPSIKSWKIVTKSDVTPAIFILGIIASGICIGLYEVVASKAIGHVPLFMKNVAAVGFAIQYAPYFLFGILLHRIVALYSIFNRFSPALVLIGISSGVIAVHFDGMVPGTIVYCASAIAALALTQSIVSCARTAFSVEKPWIRQLVDASFVIYIFHLPIIVVTNWFVVRLPIGMLAQYFTLCTVAFGGSMIVWMVVRKSTVLLYWVSGVSKKISS